MNQDQTKKHHRLLVSEVFGPTLQGEGPSSGRPCMFVRLGACNLHCSWCDTPYTWDWTRYDKDRELSWMSERAILKEVVPDRPPLLVVTGGEPLLQSAPLEVLVSHYLGGWSDHEVEIETNGTRPPLPSWKDRLWYNVSPKLAHAGDPESARIVPAAIEALKDSGQARWKFVLSRRSTTEAQEMLNFVQRFRLPHGSVWLMPEARSAGELDEKMETVAQLALDLNMNYSDRLQVRLWGNQRGH